MLGLILYLLIATVTVVTYTVVMYKLDMIWDKWFNNSISPVFIIGMLLCAVWFVGIPILTLLGAATLTYKYLEKSKK